MSPLLKIAPILLIAGLLAGCEGEPGSPGRSLLPDDLYPPTAEIILPLASRPLYDRTVIEIEANDDDSISSLEFLIDGVAAASGAIIPAPADNQFFWDSAMLPFGPHTLQLLVRDRSGKSGRSSMLLLNREERPVGLRDTLRLYNDNPNQAVMWKLPPDTLGNFHGFAVRFTPDRPVAVRFIAVKLMRKANWRGTQLWVDLYSVRDGLPDTLRSRKMLALDRDNQSGDNSANEWFRRDFPSVRFDGEFIVAVTLMDDNTGDSLAVQTDDGLWKNGHGLTRDSTGDWKPFVSGLGRMFNPLVYAIVSYP